MEFGKSPTLEAFRNKSVLITGTTGFVGKVILEKLLRSVPTIGSIYLLIRGNPQHPTAQKRFLNEVATSSIFDSLRAADPDGFEDLCRTKLHFISGELTAPNFGLSDANFAELARKIDVVINSAASVDFREPLDAALQTNTLCLDTIVKLVSVRQIPLVHVSTCYVNGYNTGLIEETVGAPARRSIPRAAAGHYEVEPVIADLQRKVAAEQARYINDADRTQALIQLGLNEAKRYGWNDTYTFTKWLGEQLLLKQLQGQSLTLVRPSIVESTWQAPVPGWIEGVKVADAIILAYAREKVTFFPGDRHAIIDIIPADLVANSIILSAAEALRAVPAHRIYQCSSSHCNPIPIKHVIQHVQDEGAQNHARYSNLFYRKPQRPFVMVPGLIFNSVVRLGFVASKVRNTVLAGMGVKVSGVRLGNLETAMKLAVVFSFYTRPRYRFSNDQLCALAERMGEHDRNLFPVDARCIDWEHYLRKVHLAGLNAFALRPRSAKARKPVVQPETAVA
jgi:nucleoside-diphosphate-sugar epimerase